MSILSDGWRALKGLFFPPLCAVCGAPLEPSEQTLCMLCRVTAPLTNYESEWGNPVEQRLSALVPIEHASAMLFFRRQGGWQQLIHDFKYHDRWRTAFELGRWYGNRLKNSGMYADVEVVIPMPLHPLKQLRRGYNQATYLAEGIACELGVSVDRRAVRRTRNTSSQAQTPRHQRAANVEGAFAVRDPERLAGRHLLLVDDVFTTGSTVAALIEALRAELPDARISVAALAVSQREIGIK